LAVERAEYKLLLIAASRDTRTHIHSPIPLALSEELDLHITTVCSPSNIESIGGGGRTRTYDLRIMSPTPVTENKLDQQFRLAESGKVRQNPQPGRNRAEEEDYYGA
jgi:hypothetical protein